MIPLLIVFIFCVGACLGSFFNALVSRFGSEKNWSPLSRSRCDVCDHRLGVLDLIPILSFLTFCRGRCRFCGRPIPAYYPVIELLTGLLCVGLVLSVLQPLHFPPLIDPNSVVSVSLLYSFVMIFFLATLFDYQYKAIPKSIIMT
ncbi:MAG: prepilin peptidase, partial [Candidatus Gracilibacteria bacterium]|nr:prepilin peptidase [Candidatus Gracilibacteria bacterium]